MMHDPELINRAQFGKQIEAFWSSRIGEYLAARTKELYTTANEALKSVDPHDWKAVQALQNDIKVAEMFDKWLSEAVQNGLQALEILIGDDDDDQN